MDFQEKQLSSLQMQHLHVKDIKFSATGKEPVRPTKMNVAFHVDKNVQSDSKMAVELSCDIDIPEIAQTQVKLAADFETDGNVPVESMLKNAIAIMFPFLRSQVTLVTSQPNFRPIILPIININNLVK